MRSIAVIGLGRFGTALAFSLQEKGVEVQAIDVDRREVQDLGDSVVQPIQLDARDRRQLEAHGVHELDIVVVAIGEDFEAAQECVVALKNLGAKWIIARAQTRDRKRILEMIGANRVVSPEEESAKRVAQSLTHPMVSETHDLGSGIEIATMKVPVQFDGKSLLDLRAEISDVGIVVVRVTRAEARPGEPRIIMPPSANTVLAVNDDITFVAKSQQVKDLASL
ncbi:MAG: trk system potassium uptake protein TrkA [Planctomycetota bacterium]|jgi:trk system potassium uptake protein TrkA